MTDAEQQSALDQALAGDASALGLLFDSFRPYVRFLARAVRRGRAPGRLDDSDLMQDALVEVHRAFPTFKGASVAELTAWLRPIVLRAAGRTMRGHLGTARRDAGREQTGLYVPDRPAPGDSPGTVLLRDETAARLAVCLAGLPEDMQAVLLGRHADELSHAELAVRLGRSEGAVRVLYTRALRRLRDQCPELGEHL